MRLRPSPLRLRLLSEKGWMKLLPDPQTQVGLDLQGLQGRFETGPDWDTQLRRIDQHLVYFFSEGQGSSVIDGKRLPLAAGSLCWVYPGTKFRFFQGTGNRSLVVYRFRFTAMRRGVSYSPMGRFRFVAQAWSLFELVRQLVLEADRSGAFSHWRKQSLVSLLSIGVFESRSMNRNETLFDDAQRTAISAFLAETAPERHTPSGLAHHLGFSHDYFSRIFRRSYGVSPRTWLLRQRLAHAAVLLRESTRRISEIAERLGYSELYLFSRQFRQVYGVSPRQWRKSIG
jgi:AraC-like DNA-binding protein